MRPEPIIEYAHKIGKNTAEFTVKDLTAFMKWWMKQAPRKDLMEATPAQRKIYKEDCQKVKEYYQKYPEAAKAINDIIEKPKRNQSMSKYNQYSRLTSNQVVDESQVDMGAVEEVEVAEAVCSMELTKLDVEALLFCIDKIFEDYEMKGHEYEKPLSDLREGLQGVE